jgi:hypothetical protein
MDSCFCSASTACTIRTILRSDLLPPSIRMRRRIDQPLEITCA